MPKRYSGPERAQIIAYVPVVVRSFIRYMAAQQPNGSETEFISKTLTAAYTAALAIGDPVALLVAQMEKKDARQDLEGS